MTTDTREQLLAGLPALRAWLDQTEALLREPEPDEPDIPDEPDPPPPPPPPPAPLPNERKAYGGKYYGCGAGWEAIGNKQIRGKNIAAATYQMTVTERCTHLRINNRVNSPGGREGYGYGNCQAWLEIRPLRNGVPDMTKLLARTDDFVPAKAPHHPCFELLKGGFDAKAGQWVAVVWRYDGKSTSEQNYYSANFGICSKTIKPRGGPGYAGSKVLTSSNLGETWVESARGGDGEQSRGAHQLWMEFGFANGDWHGQPYRFANMDPQWIDGDKMVRQVWRQPYEFTAKGFWVRAAGQCKGDPMLAGAITELDADSYFAAGSVGLPNFASSLSVSAMWFGQPRGNATGASAARIDWTFLDFGTAAKLEAGKDYELVLHAKAGAGITILPVYSGVRSGGYQAMESFGNHNVTGAGYSTDGGKTWKGPMIRAGGDKDNDWPLLLEAA